MTEQTRSLLIAFAIPLLVLTLPSLSCMGWFFYDGFVTYPQQKERWEAYEQTQREQPVNPAAWDQLARSRGWPSDPPTPRTDMDVLTQHICGGVCAATSLVFAGSAVVMLLRARRKSPARDNLPSALG